MLEVQKYLLDNNGDFNKLTGDFGIIVNHNPTDKRVILNYCQIDSYKHRFKPIVRECRGLVLNSESFSVIAKGFNRFFNIGENPGDSVFNWNKFETYEKVDGCLQYHTSLKLWGGGSISIGKIVNKELYPTLVGMDEKGNIVPTKVKAIKRTGKKNNWIRIKTDSSIKKKNFSNIENSIILTENHNIFLNNVWQPAINAKVNDYLTSYCIEPDENFIHLLNSSLLGDGSLCKNYNSFVFKESHKKPHIEYVNYLKNILDECFSFGDSRISGYGSLMERVTSKNYSLLKIRQNWYKFGKKILPEDISWIDDFSIAKWYMDDGSLSRNKFQKDRARFSTEKFSKADNERLAELLIKKYNIEVKVTFTKNKFYVLRINYNKGSIHNFWKAISKYIHPCMRYKLPEEYRNVEFIQFPKCKEKFVTKKTKIIEIKKIKDCNYKYHISKIGYDIETETNNFFAGGVLVHNSLILLYNWKNQWYVNTRNSFADKYFCDGFNKTWSEFVFDILKQENVNLNDLNYNVCYVLELCSRYNKVVRDYQTPQLFHLASFGLLDCLEKDCKIPNIKSPVKYEFDSLDSLSVFLKEQENLDPTFEGFVLNDGNARIKAKNKTYLNYHALKNNGNLFAIKNLVPFLLKGEAEELCVYFSERQDYIRQINAQIKEHLDLLYWLWEDAKKCSSKKEMVKRGLTDTPLRGMLFVAFEKGVHPKTLVGEFEDCIIKLIKQGK